MNRLVPWEFTRGGIPVTQHMRTNHRTQHRQFVEAGFAGLDRSLNQHLESLEPVADRLAIKKIRIELAFDFQRVLLLHQVEEELEIRELLGISGNAKLESVKLQEIEPGLVDVEHHRGQRQPARVARQLELLHHCPVGHLLVLIGIKHLPLHLPGEGRERSLPCRLQTQRKEIQTVPHQFVATDHRLAGRRDPNDDVLLSGETMHQGGERTEQRGEDGAAQAARGFLQPGKPLIGEATRFHGRGKCFHRRTGPVRGQLEHRRPFGILRQPKRLGVAKLLARFFGRQCPRVIRKGHRRRELDRPTGSRRVIGGTEFGHHHAEGPAVAHQVMRGKDQLVRRTGAAHQAKTNERPGLQLKRRRRFQAPPFCHARLLLLRRQRTDVLLRQFELRRRRMEDLLFPVRGERAAQGRMSTNHLMQGPLQRRMIQGSFEPDDRGFVIRAVRLRPHLHGEENLALRIRQRRFVALLRIAGGRRDGGLDLRRQRGEQSRLLQFHDRFLERGDHAIHILV